MNAKKMFEKLGYGYKRSEESEKITYFQRFGNGYFRITFDSSKKEIAIVTNIGNIIENDLLQAIIQQAKELGWIEEEKQEIKQETNLEHYFEYLSMVGSNGFALVNGRCAQCSDTHCSECDFRGDCIKKKCIWLASPYEKPTYNLTKFEKELLQCYPGIYSFKVFNSLRKMKEKGYFKDVDYNEIIGDILANCEVIE